MSVYEWKEYRIVCDICKTYGTLVSRSEWDYKKLNHNDYFMVLPFSIVGKKDMRRIAKYYGWERKNKKDICPKCYYSMEKK